MFLTVFKTIKPVIRLQNPILRTVSTKGGPAGSKEKTWKDRDSAQEKDFFNKQDGFYFFSLKQDEMKI